MAQKLLSSNASNFLAIFTAVQCGVGCLTNAFVLFYFLRMKGSLKTIADKLILNLAIADFFSLSTYVPWRSYLLLIDTSTKHSKIYTSLFVVCIFSTGNAILLIGLDRLVAVVWPLRYRIFISVKVAWIAMTTSWILAFLLGIAHYFSYTFSVHFEYELLLCALSIMQLLLLSAIYVILLKSAVAQTKKMSQRLRSFRYDQNVASTTKTIRTTFIIVCLFYVTFAPYITYRIISSADKSITIIEKKRIWRWLMAFTFLNSCFDPIVYFFGMKKYRTEFFRRRFWNRNRGYETEEASCLSRVGTTGNTNF